MVHLEQPMNRALVEVKNSNKLRWTDFPVRRTESVEQGHSALEHLHPVANHQRIGTGNRV
jgi:hypothetical protein